MFNGDRTTKTLLTLIAIFLGVLVFNSLFASSDSASQAVAQQRATPASLLSVVPGNAVQNANSQGNETDAAGNILIKGYRTIPVSTVNLNPKDKVIGLQVIDSAQAFLIQYANRVEVYRVDTVYLNKISNNQGSN